MNFEIVYYSLLNFEYEKRVMDVLLSGKYLRIFFTKDGSFLTNQEILTRPDQGMKAIYYILRKSRIDNLSIECQLDLFDKAVPILLYGQRLRVI